MAMVEPHFERKVDRSNNSLVKVIPYPNAGVLGSQICRGSASTRESSPQPAGPDRGRGQMSKRDHFVAIEEHSAPMGLPIEHIEDLCSRLVLVVSEWHQSIALGVTEWAQRTG